MSIEQQLKKFLMEQHGTAGWETKLLRFVEARIKDEIKQVRGAVDKGRYIGGGGEFFEGAGEIFSRGWDDAYAKVLKTIDSHKI